MRTFMKGRIFIQCTRNVMRTNSLLCLFLFLFVHFLRMLKQNTNKTQKLTCTLIQLFFCLKIIFCCKPCIFNAFQLLRENFWFLVPYLDAYYHCTTVYLIFSIPYESWSVSYRKYNTAYQKICLWNWKWNAIDGKSKR